MNIIHSFQTTLNLMKLSFILTVIVFLSQSILAQVDPNQQYNGNYPNNNNYGNYPNYPNYMANSNAFRQEIARVEIMVVRPGKAPLSITQVPRLQKGDVLKVRLLDEMVNGMKPDQTNFDWTFLIAYINPGRNNDAEKTVSEEIQFRKRGWYEEYSFTVPYDSQPIFFLYTKPNYRTKLLKLIANNQEEIRKIGEKTIEIADAYGKIGSFLNELQSVINRNTYQQGYGNNGYNGYGGYGGYNSYNQNGFKEQLIERLAKSFNIELPSCWNGNNGNNYNGYNNSYNNNGYNNNNYGGYNNNSGYGNYGSNAMGNDFMGRVQCVARGVKLEDFDISVSRMLQQGGIMVAAQLAQKYPQFAHWINIAAIAIDFILKLTQRTPLRIVPTITSTSGNQGQYAYNQPNYNYQNNFAATNNYSANANSSVNNGAPVKISVYAESSPRDNGFVSAYPIVTHKWQAAADPEIIELPTPVLMDQCLHPGKMFCEAPI